MYKLTMQDVLKRFYPEYMKSHKPSAVQAKAVYHITNCKTGAFGANISQCESCGYKIYHNNSCGNRSCPMCQALSNEIWVDAQNEYVLDIDYYHVVMTCPSELYPLIYGNQKEMYKLFFHAAAETMMELSKDPAYTGATPGFISILHTWGSDLSYHPHLHLLSTCGGLDPDRKWKQSREGFFLPGKVIARLFRGKFMAMPTVKMMGTADSATVRDSSVAFPSEPVKGRHRRGVAGSASGSESGNSPD